MNYDKIAKQLENPSVKLDTLARYAQGQNPAVPEFLALAEIKRRQSLVAHSAAPAQTTVQEDLVRSAAPQPAQQMPQQMAGIAGMQRPQGVAALPSGMNEQSMAGGGIVAFDDGGYVDNYAGGGIVAFAKAGEVEDPLAGLSFEEKMRLLQAQQESGDGATTKSGLFGRGVPMLGSFNKNLSAMGAPTTSTQVKAMMPADEIKGDESKLYAAEALAKKIAPKGEALPTVGPKGRMAPTREEVDALNARPKEDMYAKYEEMLKGQAAESKEARQQDKYLRLLEAGLGIMGGTSPYLATNLGQGAMGAAKGYAQDQAAARKEDRENIKELMGLGMKKEEAEREAQKLAMTEKLYGAHGRYYDAAANAAGVRAAGTGTASTTAMDKARLAAVTQRYNAWARLNPMATPEEQSAKMAEIERQVGMAGSAAAAPVAIGSWSPKSGFTATGS